VRFKKITIVGVGLLGGSLGLALKERGLAGRVTGFVRRQASVAECEERGAVDEATCDPLAAVADAELVVFCTPLAQMRPLAQQMLAALNQGAIVTDVGSVKASVVDELERAVAEAGGHFVGSHPMAGAERTGVAAARADLFSGAICVITPTPQTSAAAARKVAKLWRTVGGRVLRMSPLAHDALVSRSSHLPHVVAAQLVNLVLGPGQPPDQSVLCANGFRDTTRIASGSPEMWRDIALANRENLSAALDGFMRGLRDFQQSLKKRDLPALAQFFENAKTRRDEWAGKARSDSPE